LAYNSVPKSQDQEWANFAVTFSMTNERIVKDIFDRSLAEKNNKAY